MAKYRKKPVVVEAVRWSGKYASPGEWPAWFNAAMKKGTLFLNHGLWVMTLEGKVFARVGDMVIRGVKGELYPCKADIFALTYEGPVEG